MGGELWLGLSDSLRWERWDRMGTRLGRVVVPLPEVAVSEEEVAAERRRLLAEAEHALDVLPAYDRIAPAGSGGVWIRRAPKPQDEAGRWLLVTSEGGIRGTLVLGREEEVADASDSLVVVVGRDALDAPVVRILRLLPAGEGRRR